MCGGWGHIYCVLGHLTIHVSHVVVGCSVIIVTGDGCAYVGIIHLAFYVYNKQYTQCFFLERYIRL